MRLSALNLFLMTLISIYLFKYATPHERGFSCDDESIMKPYHPIIIRMPYLLSIALTVPLLFILFIERSFDSNLNTIYKKIKQLYFGLILTFILVLLCKVYFGRLRPNSVRGICNADHYCEGSATFVPTFVCNNSLPKLVKESRMSFYSGHSSVGTYSAFYTILYTYNTYKRFTSVSKTLLLIHLIVLLIGLIPGYTQGINYWHHWSDIGTGYTVGALTAYLVFNYVKID